MTILLKNARIVDAGHIDDTDLYRVVVEDGVIKEVSARATANADAIVIDVAGKVLMPGLIDCHVHVLASMVDLGANARLPSPFALFRAMPILRGILMRGFTTVRDAGGADYVLAQSVETGLIEGPRIFPSGKALSQTGGHGDFRSRLQGDADVCPCAQHYGSIARLVDGVDDIRKAIRQEMRRGATQIKIMASGGVSSPTDRIGNLQFSSDEIRAAVAEARAHQTYVMAHAYTAEAIARAVELGVRTIEHGNLVDDEAAALMAKRGAFVVPTLITYHAMDRDGAAQGYPAESLRKNVAVLNKGLESLQIYKRNGVQMAYGSDLLGAMHARQSDEFELRAEVYTPMEVILQATSIAADLLCMQDQLGVVKEGAIADLLVVDGDPTKDLRLLGEQGRHLSLIMKGGAIVKRA